MYFNYQHFSKFLLIELKGFCEDNYNEFNTRKVGNIISYKQI